MQQRWARKEGRKRQSQGECESRRGQAPTKKSLSGICESKILDYWTIIKYISMKISEDFENWDLWFSSTSPLGLTVFSLPCFDTIRFFFFWAWITPRIPRDFRAKGFHLDVFHFFIFSHWNKNYLLLLSSENEKILLLWLLKSTCRVKKCVMSVPQHFLYSNFNFNNI